MCSIWKQATKLIGLNLIFIQEYILRYTTNYTCEIEMINVNQKLLNLKIVLMMTTTLQI